MKVYFWSIGKAHESYIKEGTELFTKSIYHYYQVEWKIFPAAKNAAAFTEQEIKKTEAANILNAIQKGDVLIALNENGKQ